MNKADEVINQLNEVFFSKSKSSHTNERVFDVFLASIGNCRNLTGKKYDCFPFV